MKKKNLYILILSILCISIVSCTKDNTLSDTRKGGPQFDHYINQLDSIGEIHNLMLDFHFLRMRPHIPEHLDYYYLYDGKKYIKKEIFDNILTSALPFFLQRGYDSTTIQGMVNDASNIMNNASMFFRINNVVLIKDIRENVWNIINSMKNLNMISQNEIDSLNSIINAVANGDYLLADSLTNQLRLNN